MFLINQQVTGGDLAGAVDYVREILTRANAEILFVRKWDERRLAYPIKGQKRGLYILALFRVAGVQLPNIERDCNLSEKVLRALVTRADHMGDVEIELAIKEADKTVTEIKLRETESRPTAADENAPEVAEVAASSDIADEDTEA
jgi:small subunit ribosomal protein S6